MVLLIKGKTSKSPDRDFSNNIKHQTDQENLEVYDFFCKAT